MIYKIHNLVKALLIKRSLLNTKELLLKIAYDRQISNNTQVHYNDSFDSSSKIMKYYKFDTSIIDKAIKELEREEKITIVPDVSPLAFSLTQKTINEVSQKDKHPIKNYIKRNHLAIAAIIISVIALFK